MNSKTHVEIAPSGNCFICKEPVYQKSQQTKGLPTCDGCKPFYEEYDSTRIARAYSDSGKGSARIVVFIKQVDRENQHCLLQIKVSGDIQAPENSSFKSADDAMNVGKAKVNELLGEGVVFEDVKIENPNDTTEQLKLVAGIRKT